MKAQFRLTFESAKALDNPKAQLGAPKKRLGSITSTYLLEDSKKMETIPWLLTLGFKCQFMDKNHRK